MRTYLLRLATKLFNNVRPLPIRDAWQGDCHSNRYLTVVDPGTIGGDHTAFVTMCCAPDGSFTIVDLKTRKES